MSLRFPPFALSLLLATLCGCSPTAYSGIYMLASGDSHGGGGMGGQARGVLDISFAGGRVVHDSAAGGNGSHVGLA